MKVIDAYPMPSSPGKRPICEGLLSQYVAESNERRRAKYKKLPAYLKERESWWTREQARREKYKIDPDRCRSFARYCIDGHWYCRKHGAFVVLDKIVERPK